MGATTAATFTSSQKDNQQYESIEATRQVIGCLMKNTQLFNKDNLMLEDFVMPLQRLIFAIIQHYARTGSTSLTIVDIEGFLDPTQYREQYQLYIENNGNKYLTQAIKLANLDSYETNYSTLKKYSLLRGYKQAGVDVSEFCDPHEVDPVKRATIADKLNHIELEELQNYYLNKINTVVEKSRGRKTKQFKSGGVDSLTQIERFKEKTNYGPAYASNYMTAATGGIRAGRFSIMSAGTGVGKSRMMLANIAHSFAPEYWDEKTKSWEKNPHGAEFHKALYIGTEMDGHTEVEPILIGYIANVSTDTIIHPDRYPYQPGEEERVKHAAEILEKGWIYIKDMPDYTIAKLEQTIRDYHFSRGVDFFFLDYMHTNADLIHEYKQLTGLNEEYQVLNNLSVKLKDWATNYKVSIESGTQLNREAENEECRDQRALRGSSGIADKVDFASIFTKPTKHELSRLEKAGLLRKEVMPPDSQLRCISVYKNRGGKDVWIKIWVAINYGTMRVHDLFVTDYEIDNTYNELTPITLRFNPLTEEFEAYANSTEMAKAIKISEKERKEKVSMVLEGLPQEDLAIYEDTPFEDVDYSDTGEADEDDDLIY